jgi:hypothetical protein
MPKERVAPLSVMPRPRASTIFLGRFSEYAFMRAWWHVDHLLCKPL